jgi:DNA primase
MHVSIVQIPEPHDPDSYILEFGKAAYLQLLKNKKNPLDIKIHKFYRDFNNPNQDEKYKFINDIISDLVSIPNKARIGFNLRRLAERLELSESLLIGRFNDEKKKKKYFRYNQNKEDNDKSDSPIIIKRGEWKAEEGILSILLKNDKDATKEIFDQLSSSDFENENYRQIFEVISHEWEDRNSIELSKVQSGLNEDIIPDLSALSFNEVENIPKFTNDCIYKLRKWHLNARYGELRRMLQEESKSQKSVNHYLNELNEIKKQLIEVENSHHKSNL